MGGKTTTSTNKVTIPKEVLDRYNAVNAQAANVAQNPFQKYGTTQEDFVAQFNEQQLKGVQGINDVAGMGAVYENVDKYLNPYTKNVADTTRAQMEQANEQAQSGALGTAVQSGAFGGDRAGVAAANLSNQQNLAMGSTMANIYNQGYTQAIDTSMNDRNRMLGVAGAQLGAGTQMQQTEQAGLDALINQFQQEQGYPFQVAQFLANIAMGTGALSGSTTTSTQMAPFWSDRRLKHDIKKIGEADNGLPIYTFKYKGDENQQTHVGFMADEVEKKNPDAVGLDPSGYKTVDYDKAAQSMGGAVKAFADGGVAGPYGSKVGQGVGVGSYVPQAYLPVGELMVADPSFAESSQTNFLDTLNSAATAGESVLKIRNLLRDPDKKEQTKEPAAPAAAGNIQEFEPPKGNIQEFEPPGLIGGGAGGFAEGGGVKPQVHGDYMSTTLAAQAADKDKPELKVAGQQGQQSSGLANVASALGSIASIASLFPSDRRLKHDIKRIGKTEKGLPIYTFKYKGDNREQTHIGFMADEVERNHPEAVGERNGYKTVDYSQAHKFATGGVAGRHGYALDGTVEERLRDAMRLTRDEVPAVQTLGSLPDAGVVAVEAPSGVAPVVEPRPTEGGVAAGVPVGAYEEMASTMREAGIANLAGDKLVPTGVAPADGQIRPKPRPEGLGAAAAPVVAPVVPAKPAADTRRKIASVIGGGKGFTDVMYNDGTKDRITGNLNFRNNNPGNIEYGDLAKSYGAVGTDGRFAVFPDYETGRKAQEALLFDSGVYEGKTIGSAIAKYAPLGDGNNDPVAYANNVAAALGVPVDTPLSALNPEQRNAMLTAMEKQEGGGGLSAFSTTPLGTDGSPVPLRGGVAGGAGSQGRRGGVKPYDERNTLGKMVYDEDGKVNRDALLSLFAGLGDMLTSPSPFLLPSIGAGISGAARTYMAREEQVADIENKKLDAMKKVSDETIRYNSRYGTNYTPAEYEALALDIDTPPPDNSRVSELATYGGVPLDPFGGSLNELMDAGNGTFIRAADSLQYNERLLAEQQRLLASGAVDAQTVANTAAQIEEIKARNGVVPVLNADGSQKVDASGNPVYTTDSTVARIEQARVAQVEGDKLKAEVGDRIAASETASTAVDKMVDTIVAAGDQQGILAPIRDIVSGVAQELGLGTGNFRALQNEMEKSRASFISANGELTDMARNITGSSLPSLSNEAAANAYVAATMQAYYEREAKVLAAIEAARSPQEAYTANIDEYAKFDMKAATEKYYNENIERLNSAIVVPSNSEPVRVTTQEEYNALPPGTPYIDSQGKRGVKQ